MPGRPFYNPHKQCARELAAILAPLFESSPTHPDGYVLNRYAEHVLWTAMLKGKNGIMSGGNTGTATTALAKRAGSSHYRPVRLDCLVPGDVVLYEDDVTKVRPCLIRIIYQFDHKWYIFGSQSTTHGKKYIVPYRGLSWKRAHMPWKFKDNDTTKKDINDFFSKIGVNNYMVVKKSGASQHAWAVEYALFMPFSLFQLDPMRIQERIGSVHPDDLNKLEEMRFGVFDTIDALFDNAIDGQNVVDRVNGKNNYDDKTLFAEKERPYPNPQTVKDFHQRRSISHELIRILDHRTYKELPHDHQDHLLRSLELSPAAADLVARHSMLGFLELRIPPNGMSSQHPRHWQQTCHRRS